MIRAGSDVNAEDNNGDTPLFNHVQSIHTSDNDATDVVRTLVNAGADPHVRDSSGRTLLNYAVIFDRPLRYIRVLIEIGVDVNAEDNNGDTPLFNHVQSIHTSDNDATDVVRTLVNAGADPHVRDSSGRTLLNYAVIFDRPLRYIRVLIEIGVDVNAEDNNGDTPLFNHVQSIHTSDNDATDVVRTLVNAGADPHVRDSSGRTLLNYAVIFDRPLRYIRVLIEIGVDVNAEDNNGDTPLVNHVQSIHTFDNDAPDVVRTLGRAGANPFLRDASGETALQIARRLDRSDNYIQALIDIGGVDATLSVSLSVRSLTIDEGESGTYTVVLESSPDGPVTVTPSSDNGDVTVSPSSLSFDADNWDEAQTVTVRAAHDDDAVGDSASVAHTVSGYGDVTDGGAVSVSVVDDDSDGVTLSVGALTIDEGESRTYTVELESQPDGPISIALSSDNGDVTVSPSSLSFDADNWDEAQTVTVRAAHDDDAVGDSASVAHTVSGYGDVTDGGAVSVSVVDDDSDGVTLSVGALTIDEGESRTYTVELESQPDGPISIALSSDNEDVTVSPSSLSFDADNWDEAQTVTVRAAHDDDAVDDSASVAHTVSGYGDVTDGGTVSVSVNDDDSQGVRLSVSTLTIDEEGEGGTYTVVLESNPDGPVSIALSSDNEDVTVSPGSLSFDADNWDEAQTVTVRAAHDDDAVGDSASVAHTVSGYGDVTDGGAVSVSVVDDDSDGVTLSVGALTIDEGESRTYTVELESQPDGPISIALSSDNGDVTVSPSSLSFDADNWDEAQTVTVRAAHDDDAVGDSASVAHTVSGYGDVTDGGAVSVSVVDDDSDGVTLSVGALTIDEGESRTYTVELESQPDGPISIALSSDNGDVTVSPSSLSFDADNWDEAQTVTVRAAHDDDAVGDSASVAHTVSGYGDVTDGGTVSVSVNDDDSQGVRLSVSTLTIDEEGEGGTYTVVLESNPDGPVSIALSSDNEDVTVSPGSLSFDATNWDEPQTVTVSAAHDDDAVGDSASVAHTVSGYGDVTALPVAVRVNDNEPEVEPGVQLSVSALTIDEGGSGSYTVVLESNPDGPVTIAPSSSSTEVTVSPPGLDFDASNWDAPQTVSVSTISDADTVVERVTITHSVTGYGDVVTADAVEVTVNEVSPQVVPEVERAAVTDTLATVTATTVSNIATNIGARFSAARTGTSLTSLSLAGHSATQPSAFQEMGWNSLWNQESHSRTLSSDELLRSTDFQIVLGASEGTQAQAAETWTFWGRGDLQFFSSQPSQGSSYNGDLRAGYFGLDTQVDDQWLAGVAVSRTMAEASYALGTSGADNDGSMDVTLTSLIPYVRFAPDDESELWAIVGVGQGEIENTRPNATAEQESSDAAMFMASAGGRHAVALGDPLDWALLGDVGFGRVLTEDGVEAIAGLTVDTWQARVGVEGSYTADLGDGSTLTTFMEVAGRYDGGDEGEAGLELSPGMYIATPDAGFGFELRGRALVLHSAENYEEYGLSATASVTPRSDGTGLSLSLSPRWGDDTGGADTLWRDDGLGLLGSPPSDRNAMSLDARVGYGVKAMKGLLTPFSEFGLREEDSQYWRIGARFDRTHANPGALSLELSGERRQSLSGDYEHRVGLISRMQF